MALIKFLYFIFSKFKKKQTEQLIAFISLTISSSVCTFCLILFFFEIYLPWECISYFEISVSGKIGSNKVIVLKHFRITPIFFCKAVVINVYIHKDIACILNRALIFLGSGHVADCMEKKFNILPFQRHSLSLFLLLLADDQSSAT